jgi:hypothetical protein
MADEKEVNELPATIWCAPAKSTANRGQSGSKCTVS